MDIPATVATATERRNTRHFVIHKAILDIGNMIVSFVRRITVGDLASSGGCGQQIMKIFMPAMNKRKVLADLLSENTVLWSTNIISHEMANSFMCENKSLVENYMAIYTAINALSEITIATMFNKMQKIADELIKILDTVAQIFKKENMIIMGRILNLQKKNDALMAENKILMEALRGLQLVTKNSDFLYNSL